MRGLIVLRMTRARTLASGLGNPPLLQLLLDAVTCAFVCLVQGVAATFGMRFNHRARDWHTVSVREALPQTKPDIHQKASPHQHGSFSGKRSASRESRLENPKGQADTPLETINRDSRHKAENDPVDVDRLATSLSIRVPREGGGSGQRATRAPQAHHSHPAHSDERRNPGPTVRLVPPCSFKPAHAGKPFLDSGIRRNARRMLHKLSLI